MKQYSTSGTLGDTYITCLKLKPIIESEGEVQVNHFTKHNMMYANISRIYQACFGDAIKIKFVLQRDAKHLRIHSDFEADDLPYDAFPEFEFANNEYYDYTAVCPRAGKEHETWRSIPEEELNDIFSGNEHCELVKDDGTYTLPEAMQMIKDAKSVYCYQGLMAYVALSMKRPTTVYIGPDHEVTAFRKRVCPEWIPYLAERIRRV